jgi:hypothetical protein
VDDNLIAATTIVARDWYLGELKKHLPIGSVGPCKRFLGIDISVVYNADGIFHIEASLETYIKDLPKHLNLSEAFLGSKKIPVTPLTVSDDGQFMQEPSKYLAELDTRTQQFLGTLRWATNVYPSLLRAISFPQHVERSSVLASW